MAGKAFSEVSKGWGGVILLRTLGWRCLLFGFVALGGRSVNAETLTIDVDNHTNAAPLVLSETLTITGTGNGFVQTGAVNGTGDLHFSLPGKEAFLLAPNTSTGDLHVDLGTVTMTNAAALGTGTVYVNEEETRNVLKVCRLDAGGASMTVGHPFVLGTEDTASWGCRMLCQDGTFSLTGNISVNRSKIAARSACVSIGGGVKGSKVVLAPDSSSVFVVEMKPLTLTDSFWIGAGGTVRLSVAGSTVPGVYGFGTSTLVLDGENFYPSGADFATQDSDTSHFVIDVAGHSQLMGGFAGEGANKRPCTLRNSNGRVCPTLTLTQTVDNLTTNLHFEGAFNVVKVGRARLTAGEAVKGDLAVEAGTYALGRKIPGLLARDVTVGRGAMLDLGGQSAACRTLRIEGGTVANGTLRADRIVLKGAAVVGAKLVGDVEVEQDGEEEAVLRGTALETVQEVVPSYRLPRGTVAYFPFDGSSAAALLDRSGGKGDLSVRSGTPVWEPEGRLGGCIYFDGTSTLASEPFPSTVPVGNAPVTIAAWIRIADACGAQGGWLSYGDKANGRGCSLRLSGFGAFNWYANGNDVQGRSGASLKDGAWHYVVATSDGTVRKLFCDGTEIGSAKTGLDVFPTLFMLGRTMHDAHFTGWLDDVLIVNRALEPAEIRSLYQSGGVPRTETAASGRTLGVRSGTLALLSNDCVANWPFASAETLFADASGQGHDLIVGEGDGATVSADSPFGFGTANGSLELDGKTWLTASAFPDLPTGNVARTVACFVKPVSGCAEEGAILNWGNEGWASGRYMNFALRSFGRAMGLFPWGAEDRVDFGSADCTRGRWTSFVAVWNGAEIAYYTNGVLALGPRAYVGVASLATDAGGFKIGKAFYGEKSFFKGNLAELAVWDRALSEAEVRDYVRNGVARTDGLPDSVTLEVSAGATCRVPRGGQVLAGLNGAGTVEGDVTLRAGAVVSVRENGPVTVKGSLAFAGDGTVALPEAGAAAFTRYPLFSATRFAGETNLAAWRCVNVPKGYKASVAVRDGVVEAVVCAGGMAVIIR